MSTYYTKHNAGGGGVGSFADPWTLQEAADGAIANDLVLVCNTGTYALTGTATIDFDTNAGGLTTPVIFRGANADGSDDGTIATISGAGMDSGHIFYMNLISWLMLDNLRLTAARDTGLYIGSSSTHAILRNCRVDNSVARGVRDYQSGSTCRLLHCEIDNNVIGLYGHSLNRGHFYVFRCSIHDNSSHGVEDGGYSMLIDNLIYDNGGDGFNSANGEYGRLFIMGNVFFGNTGDGIELNNIGGMNIIENNILRSNGGYGINTNTGVLKAFLSCRNNCSHNNTSGHIDINGGVLPGSGHVTADPKFISEVDGSEDFGLESDSPCLAAGIDAGIW